jgi:hypothetical protein
VKMMGKSNHFRNTKKIKRTLFALVGLCLMLFLGSTASAQTTDVYTFEAETMTVSPSGSSAIQNLSDDNGSSLWIQRNATATKTVMVPSAADTVKVRTKAVLCQGGPTMTLKLNGTSVSSTTVSNTSFQDLAFPLSQAVSGSEKVDIVFSNDLKASGCDRSFYIDQVEFTSSGSVPPPPPPPPPPPAAQCADGVDNDSDGKVDYPADPGCTDASDNDETDSAPPPSGSGASLGVFAGQNGGDGGAWESSTMTAVHQFESQSGVHPKMVHMYYPFYISGSCAKLPPGPATAIREGYAPLLTLEFTNYGGGKAPAFTYANINNGTFDACFRAYAQQAKGLSGPLYLRIFHEMNGGWYSWKVAGQEQAHINAWRRIHNIFASGGASNVKMVWCPNTRDFVDAGPYANYYPGDDYVETLCLDGYNWGTTGGGWKTFDTIYSSSYNEMAALSSSDPIIIGEYGSDEDAPAGTSKAAWMSDHQAAVKNYSRIKVLNWFNQIADSANWPVTSSASALAAYQQFAADSYNQSSMP